MKKRTIKLFCVGIAGALAVSAYIQKFHKSETDLLFSNIEALADPEQSTNKFDWVPPTINCSVWTAKLLQKSEMRKDIVIELSYKGFG